MVRLPDGRTLGYAITGDPAGPPVFYFHGWPASRLEAALVEHLPVRLIAADRPGYGASTPQPRRRLLDWPADVAALADHLGIGDFRCVGVSGGGPYALACAYASPRVIGTALLSPIPPLTGHDAPPDDTLGEGLLQLRRLGQYAPVGRAILAAIRLAVELGLFDPEHALQSGFSASDTACMTAALRQQLVASWREGLRPGVDGAISDARIYASAWGFDLAAIRSPVTVWHGGDDAVVPPRTLVAYRALRTTPRLVPGEGHYSLALTRSTDVLAGMLAV